MATNQRLATDGSTAVGPGSALKLCARKGMIRLAPLLSRFGLVAWVGLAVRATRAYEALVLPDFDQVSGT